ncbi:helix-turn-helix transcriptional regulator [Kitasatospora sp. NPDC088779]|uniref:helix-turn-helix transcriptional regulator n=1 Tax=Kitasatospora sp. NPDC088779 TaxID=3154964 RepID=UPI003425D74A
MPDHPTRPLTAREADIIRHTEAGLSPHRIATALYISEQAVRTTLLRAYRRLGVRTCDQAVQGLNRPGGNRS